MIAPARVAAFNILRALDSGRTDLPTALAAEREALSDDRDKALAAEIATLMENPARLAGMAAAAKSCGAIDASERLAGLVLQTARR